MNCRAIATAISLAVQIGCNQSQADSTPGYNHQIPEGIMTPDTVNTLIGTLELFDGMPNDATVQQGSRNCQ
jgi:hypothetical protein